MFDLSKGVRKIGAASTLQTTSINDIITYLKADSFQIVTRKESGTDYLQVVNTTTEDYISIKIGEKVGELPKGPAMVKSLIDNYVIYSGETTNGVWFTFGPEPTSTEPVVVVSVAELMGKTKVGDKV